MFINIHIFFKITFNELRWLESHKALHILTILLYYHNERWKLNEIEKVLEKMNHYKNSCMEDPFKELSFLISPGLNYLGINFVKCKSKT